MAGKSVAQEAAVLNTLDGTEKLGFYTAAPTDSTPGTEVSGGSYAPQLIAWGAVSGGSPSQRANSGQITFPVATADWGTLVAWAVKDGSTGAIKYWGTMTPLAVATGNQVVVPVGALVVTEN